MSFLDQLIESNLVPEPLIRLGIRYLLSQKLRVEYKANVEDQNQVILDFVADLKQSPIAIETQAANDQHYEVPSDFYHYCLGPRRKYSGCYWTPETKTLAEAEETMLQLSCDRAQIEDGQRILDLGCGWGSMSLWLAEKYPQAKITGLSNSRSQKAYIDSVAQAKGFKNLEIITGNIVDFDFEGSPQFDRVISIEMFEHMKNYEALLRKIRRWVRDDGRLFVHIFTHKTVAYHYEDQGPRDWMTRYFFSGGTMPSHDLLLYFQDDFTIANQWAVNGVHYQKTAEAWLENMKRHRSEILPILASTYGEEQVTRWWVYWQVFFMACAELWGYDHGNEWHVSHYLFNAR
ncbi:MAG: cyclopropane-fatty-acyl-phospholipid synthase family protein [Cyanobacteria bacterium]|nr:cyclopropane-fatty-acyl-phospholipid synthase family protein [Cyanobacteriota bacterium]